MTSRTRRVRAATASASAARQLATQSGALDRRASPWPSRITSGRPPLARFEPHRRAAGRVRLVEPGQSGEGRGGGEHLGVGGRDEAAVGIDRDQLAPVLGRRRPGRSACRGRPRPAWPRPAAAAAPARRSRRRQQIASASKAMRREERAAAWRKPRAKARRGQLASLIQSVGAAITQRALCGRPALAPAVRSGFNRRRWRLRTDLPPVADRARPWRSPAGRRAASAIAWPKRWPCRSRAARRRPRRAALRLGRE